MLTTHRAVRNLLLIAAVLMMVGACQDATVPTAPLTLHPSFTQVAASPVVNSLNDPGDGTCDDSECTLREAVSFASNGATITFASTLTGTITLASGELAVNKNLTIAGPTGGTITVSGNNASRVFYLYPGTNVTLNNLTVSGGNGVGHTAQNAYPGESGWGGGILEDGGTLTVRNSTVSGNSSGTYRGGGGIAVLYGILTVEKSTISGNSGSWYGGGIFSDGTITVKNTTISGNSVRDGMGAGGGGVYNYGKATILYSTITANTAGGLDIHNNSGETKATMETRVKGSIIAANSGGDFTVAYSGTFPMLYTSLGYNVVGTATGLDYSSVFLETDQTGVANPGLGTLAPNGGPTKTFALQEGSAALDFIPAASCTDNAGVAIATDQRGISRPQGTDCDAGAYELQVSGGTTPAFTFDLATLPAKTFGEGNFSVSSYANTNSTGAITFATGAGSVGCSVTSAGLVSITGAAVNSNYCILEASLAADATYTSAGPLQQSFHIAKAVGSVTINNLPASGAVGGSFTPTYTKSGDGTASTASNSTSICTVSSGVVSYIAAGTCRLEASVTAGTNYLAATGSEQTFTVSLSTPTFTFDLSTLSAKTYGDGNFSVSGYVSTNSTGAVSFALGSGSVGCSVSSAGMVTITGAAVSSSHCVIAATLAASEAYAGAGPIDQSFNIAKATASVTINNMPASATVGGQFTPTHTTPSDGSVSVASLTTGVCTVNSGVVNFIATGTCTLQASVTEGTNHLAATGSQQGVTVSSAPVVFSSSCTYTINAKNNQRQVTVSWANADPGVTQIQVSDTKMATKQLAPAATGAWSTNVKTLAPTYALMGGTSRRANTITLVAAGTACVQQ